jgi:hypothetical protein
MSNKETIEPELFEIVTEYSTHYVVAYDSVHAITSLLEKWRTEKDIISVKKLTGNLVRFLLVSKECLPQGLVNKNIENE